MSRNSTNSASNNFKISKTASKNNNIVTLQGKTYKATKLLSDIHIPYKLTINRNTDSLFFCVNANDNQTFKSAVLNLNTGKHRFLRGIRNGFSSAVDHINNIVYIGSCDGIYKFDNETNDVLPYPFLRNVDILDMFFHKELYYVDTSNQKLHVIQDNKSSLVSRVKDAMIEHFAFDGNDNFYFVNSSGLHVLPKGSTNVLTAGGIKGVKLRGINIDTNGMPYFIAEDGIYKLDSRNRLYRILPVQNGYGITFDSQNNLIYSTERSIIKLSPWKPPKRGPTRPISQLEDITNMYNKPLLNIEEEPSLRGYTL